MESTICEKCTKRSRLNDLIVICIDCFNKEKNKYIDEIKKLIEKHDNHDCLVCGKYFDKCGCYYDLSDAYIEEISKIIGKK